uniref:Uncharacterized protein n=1 Tax=Dulem virus 225 TaxID=3145702 RepID=A0AAU8AYH6_9VIRU
MKQLIFRIIPGAPGVYDCVSGHIVDGQFVSSNFEELPADILSYIQVDTLLGTAAYVEKRRFSGLCAALFACGSEITLYPNFVVFDIPSNESKEEKGAQ